jgi:type IV pilus assembly protein PilN
MQQPRISINLASEPFRGDRPVLVAAGVAAVMLAALLGVLVTIVVRERDAAAESRALIAQVQARVRATSAEQARLEAQLRLPENSAVFNRSVFINSLLVRKGISWTRLFEDLERVFPGNVRLVAVRPYLTGDSRVQLDMVVGAQAPEPVVLLLQRLESSEMFGSTALISSQPPSQNEPLYRFRVSVNYAQKL